MQLEFISKHSVLTKSLLSTLICFYTETVKI